jgi:hypothetical protein
MLFVRADIHSITGTDLDFLVPEKYTRPAVEDHDAMIVRVLLMRGPASRLDPEISNNELPGAVRLADHDPAVGAPGIRFGITPRDRAFPVEISVFSRESVDYTHIRPPAAIYTIFRFFTSSLGNSVCSSKHVPPTR